GSRPQGGPDTSTQPAVGPAATPSAPDPARIGAPERTGTVAWALGFLAYFPIPVLGLILAGLVQLTVGLAQRKHGHLAAVNGIRGELGADSAVLARADGAHPGERGADRFPVPHRRRRAVPAGDGDPRLRRARAVLRGRPPPARLRDRRHGAGLPWPARPSAGDPLPACTAQLTDGASGQPAETGRT